MYCFFSVLHPPRTIVKHGIQRAHRLFFCAHVDTIYSASVLMLFSLTIQFLVRLMELMSHNRFETISAFLHVVKPSEVTTVADDPLKKVRPLYDNIKDKCLFYYQPQQELSADKQMVKSKARSKFKQYFRNKPTKWGFKFWVLADLAGYTCDFDLYLGKRSTIQPSGFGLGYDTVMELTKAF